MFNLLAEATPALKETGDVLGKVAEPVFGATTKTSLPILVATIINGALGLLGIVFVALAIYGGYTWMMARGKEEEVEKAKNILEQATIGLIIILVSYALTRFVVGIVGGTAAGGGSQGGFDWGGYHWF